MGLLQTELDETLKLWNNHYIRSVKNSESPAGRPNVLFFTPQLSQGRDCKYPLSSSDLEASREFVEKPPLFACMTKTLEFCNMVRIEKNLGLPLCANTAKNLFWTLVREIEEANED